MTAGDEAGAARQPADPDQPDVDVVVVGVGFAGLYLLYRLRELGFSAVAFETGDDVGGTWFWNRYPGARCDVPSLDYSYSFDLELDQSWRWSEKYATQPEILRYLQHVADKHDLRRDVRFCTRVVGATWDDEARLWRVRTEGGDEVSCRHYVMSSGCLSVPKQVDIEGVDQFEGEVFFTHHWPREGADFRGKRVAVIGTGSSGIQSIPLIAREAAQLTVFQRTPNFSMPAHNRPLPTAVIESFRQQAPQYRQAVKWSPGGVPSAAPTLRALSVSEAERRERFEAAWVKGELNGFYEVFADILLDPGANETLAEFIRSKIRAMVRDPETAESLCPKDHPFGTKRPCLDTDYFAAFNLEHVRLVDLRKHPIQRITPTGIDTDAESLSFDAIVFATGFDAMTGAVTAVDIVGKDGRTLREKWAHGPATYLGLTTTGFPNLFLITGPGSPSVLSNMVVSIEQHVDWVVDCLADLRRREVLVIEPTDTAEAGWVRHVNDCANLTLYPTARSWYTGANVPGKPPIFLPYIGGLASYRRACDEVVERDYLGFALSGTDGTRCNDGIVRRLQPDVAAVLDLMVAADLPAVETMTVEDARAFLIASAEGRPPGPEVGEVVDGTYPGATGDLAYRLYRPATTGPHPVVVYFHGSGWVLGDATSDDPLCRDLCVRSGAIVLSVDYRHAPEAPYPAAVDDGLAAVRWASTHAAELGGIPDELALCGWSAGGNIAAVVCHRFRDPGGPAIRGQLLLTPVVDCDSTRPSYVENATGYGLTASMIQWFWKHYADGADQADPNLAPLRADDLSGLPPTVVVTCEFDPLRDEGIAYATAVTHAGVPVRHIAARGHTHASLALVDIVRSGAAVRAQIGEALRGFFAGVPAAGTLVSAD